MNNKPIINPSNASLMEPEQAFRAVGLPGTLALSQHQVKILHKCLINSGIADLMNIAERTARTKFRNQVLNPLIEAGYLEMTIPEKPTSSKQKYRLTEKGKRFLKGEDEE